MTQSRTSSVQTGEPEPPAHPLRQPALRPIRPPFHTRVVQDGRVRIVEIEGELDILTAPTLAAAVKDDDAFDALVVDFGKMPFISSAGLRVIVALHRRLSRRGGAIALVAVEPFVREIVEIVGLADALIFAADVPSAMRLLSKRA